MKAIISYILWIFFCLSLNSCSKDEDDNSKQNQESEEIVLSSLKQKSISLLLRDNEIADKVCFDIGENIEYFKFSSEKARKVTEPYYEYTKKNSEEASLEIEFTLEDLDFYWEIHLTYKAENSGSYIGYVEYGNDDNYKKETIYGTFFVSDYSKENDEGDSKIDFEYLFKNIWFSTETDLNRFFAFYDNNSYKHYCDLGDAIVKEKGEYVFNEGENTLKLYYENGSCLFDFKILKLTESEVWLAIFDVIDKKYPISPDIKLRIAKESDDIPDFIINGENDKNIDYKYLTKGIWLSYHETVNEFFRFDNDYSFKRYMEFAHGSVIKEKGKYVIDEDGDAIKFYNDNDSLLHDFKVFKLTEKEFWMAANKESITSPTIELSLSKDGDNIPRFILDKESEIDDDFNISEPIIEDVNTNSVVVKGTIIGEGVNFKNRGLCISTKEYPTVDDVCIIQNSNVINKTITDLYPGTTYYVRLYAEVYNQIFYGNQVSFTTKGDKIEKIILTDTLEVTNLEKAQIHIQATLPYGIGKYGLCYGKTPHPVITDGVRGEADQKTSWILTGIECGYDYYVRAYRIEGTKVVYFEDSEIKIQPLKKEQLTYDFNFSESFNLSITFTDFLEGEYEIIPTVWRWKDAYYKEHEGKNYAKPKKHITIGKEPVTIDFSGTLSTESHQMPSYEDRSYHFDWLDIIKKNNDSSQKRWHITKEEL